MQTVQNPHSTALDCAINFISTIQFTNNNFFASKMNLQDFEKLQRQLHALHHQNSSLRAETASLRTQVHQLNARNAELQTLANNQPIRLITQQLDPLALSNNFIKLEDKISSQAYQIAYLNQLAQDKSLLIAQAQAKVTELEFTIEEGSMQVKLLQHQLNQASIRDERMRKEVENWKARLEKSNQDHLRAINQKEELTRRLKQEQNKNYGALLQLAKHVTTLKEKPKKETSSKNQEKTEIETFETLSKIQQEELHERNQEITRLKAINGNSGDTGEQHLKNTIKHLRGQLSRYCNLIQHVTDKLALAQATIQRYSTSADKCNQELASLQKLNQRIYQQDATIKSLQGQLRQKTEELEKEKKQKNDYKKNLVQVLKENQGFHFFINETYGESFDKMIQSMRNLYQDKSKQRRKHEKWVTVDELVETNEHLRARLKIA